MKTSVRINLVAAVILILISAPLAFAESQKIAVVDLQKVLQTSKAGQAAQKQFQAETKEAQSEVSKKREQFEKQQDELRSQATSLSDKARGEKQEKLIEVKKDLDRSMQDLQESLERKNQQIVSDLLRNVKAVVAEIGKKGGYSIVLEKNSQGLIYVDGVNDITEDVIKDFDSK